MGMTYKVLGQVNPSANTPTTLYTVPAATTTVASTINICNLAATAGNFQIAVRPAGATLTNAHYLAYNTTVPAYDSIAMTIGITLATTDVVTVVANTTTISFNLFGSEIT
jgi:hypothetical protein